METKPAFEAPESVPQHEGADSFPAAVPIELHGHRKKLEFLRTSIERYRSSAALAPRHVRVLEVGCSNGRNVTMPLASYGYHVTGLDIHEESIEYAKARNVFSNARFILMDLAELPAEDSFEIVVLSDVLEHVDDPASLCAAAVRHLAPGGLVLISIPNGFGPYELEQRFLQRTRLDRLFAYSVRKVGRLLRRPSSMQGKPVGGPAYNYESGHVQFFHLSEFFKFLDRAGLEVQQSANGALFGGTLSINFLGRVPLIVRGSLKLADFLPQRWVSTWYFACSVRSDAPCPGMSDNQLEEARTQAQAQWNANPCGAVGSDQHDSKFFAEVEDERFHQQYWQKEFFDYGSFRGRNVLEIGVGLGTDLKQFARGGAHCFGVDITDTHLELTRKNFELEGLAVELRKSDATRLPFPDNYFDCVYSFGVIHHIPDAGAVLTEVQRVLKPGGTFQVAVYHRFSIHTLYLFAYAIAKGQLRTLGVSGILATIEKGADGIAIKPYVKLYSLVGLRRLLRRRGFALAKQGVRHVDFENHAWLNVFRRAEWALGWYVCAIARKPE